MCCQNSSLIIKMIVFHRIGYFVTLRNFKYNIQLYDQKNDLVMWINILWLEHN